MTTFIRIAEGELLQRDVRKKTAWKSKIGAFELAKFPVTQELYFRVTGQRPSAFHGDSRPVDSVSWLDAAAFCNRLSELENRKPAYRLRHEDADLDPGANGYRLPTEAEWEYACRAGSTDITYGPLDEISWYSANSGNTTHDVGTKAPNAWGLHDMLGNVWEWCDDLYDEAVYGRYRVFRGGGWADEARGCLVTNRRRSHPTYRVDDLGFRLARNLGMLLCLLGSFLARAESLAVPPPFRTCKAHTECTVVETLCSFCCGSQAIHRKHVEAYEKLKQKKCEGFSGGVCDCVEEPSDPKCVKGRCVLVPKKTPKSN